MKNEFLLLSEYKQQMTFFFLVFFPQIRSLKMNKINFFDRKHLIFKIKELKYILFFLTNSQKNVFTLFIVR
jgi:hypothetical protein